jgi:hypothetical protein
MPMEVFSRCGCHQAIRTAGQVRVTHCDPVAVMGWRPARKSRPLASEPER